MPKFIAIVGQLKVNIRLNLITTIPVENGRFCINGSFAASGLVLTVMSIYVFKMKMDIPDRI